jgi:hypothetical protein
MVTSVGAPTLIRSHEAATNTPTSRKDTAGPIAATSISVLPVTQSPLIWATPPNSQSLMPSTVRPR